MALKPCLECKKEISTDANPCPNCGKNAPHRSFGSKAFFALLPAVLLITPPVYVWYKLDSWFHGDDDAKATPVAKAQDAATCRKDINCWGSQHAGEALAHCRPLIERQAQYAHEWTDGALSAKLGGYVWKDQKHGVVTFFGDKIRFQNGFGAWQNMIYECDFDGTSLLDVRVRAGKL